MHDENLLEGLFDPKSLSILRLFVDNKSNEFYLREIAKKSNVSVTSTFRIIARLKDLKVVDQIMVNKFKLYKLSDNDNAKFLMILLREKSRAIEGFVELAKNVHNIDEIILHGKQENKHASLILIGYDIASGDVKKLCADIKEKHNFTISTLSLGREQFEQMKGMDLFPRVKRLLYRR
ncbi:hypothetical protein KY313_02400 [Candidatus Woesearchaeota archaeon]|jgi:hypothetical protein|nr:hypothetical protein [Candidatus Woesearchaeota archaeon]